MKSKCFSLLACLSLFGTVCAQENEWIRDYLVTVPDFPQQGIMFQWYADLLKDPDAFHRVIETFAARYEDTEIDAIAGLDSRGFVFGTALAYELGVPFIMIRKAGKLPRKVERIDYALEYGKNSFEIEVDALSPGDRVVVIDDVLATGGTIAAASELIERLGGEVVEAACLIELTALQGRKKIARPVYSLVTVD